MTPPLLLHGLKHEHNWTCWEPHNGAGGGEVRLGARLHAWLKGPSTVSQRGPTSAMR